MNIFNYCLKLRMFVDKKFYNDDDDDDDILFMFSNIIKYTQCTVTVKHEKETRHNDKR